ncbi:hypothetical protein AB1N83_012080 [Pleurotus pulmonarius]
MPQHIPRLPTELLHQIFSQLCAPYDLVAVCCVCHRFHAIALSLLAANLHLPDGDTFVADLGWMRTFYEAFGTSEQKRWGGERGEGEGLCWPSSRNPSPTPAPSMPSPSSFFAQITLIELESQRRFFVTPTLEDRAAVAARAEAGGEGRREGKQHRTFRRRLSRVFSFFKRSSPGTMESWIMM